MGVVVLLVGKDQAVPIFSDQRVDTDGVDVKGRGGAVHDWYQQGYQQGSIDACNTFA